MHFDQVAIHLLSGQFICEATTPDWFRWLNNPAIEDEMSSYLGRLGRCLSKTPGGQAYYVGWKRVGPGERAEIKRTFAQIKQTIRPVIHFLTLCMEIEKKDRAPVPGDRIEYSMVLKTIIENPHLLEALREFGIMGKEFAASDSSAKSMLDKVLQQMERQGYLIMINAEQGVYRFTGKLDYYYQVIDFLMENEGIVVPSSEEQEDVPDQRKLV